MGADDAVMVLSTAGLCVLVGADILGSVAGEAAAFPFCLASAGTFKTVVLVLRMERLGIGL